MFRKTRIFCFTLVIFFLISCFAAVSSYASTTGNVSSDAKVGSGNIANDKEKVQNEADREEGQNPLENIELDATDKESDSSGQPQNSDTPSSDTQDKTSQDEQTQDQTTQDQSTQDQPAVDTGDKDIPPSDDTEDGSDKTPEDSTKDKTSAEQTTPKPKNDESLWYIAKIPMKKEHQKVLWDYCKLRKIDYIDMLSLISTESNFNEKANGKYKGYFQISVRNCSNLAKILKTPNNPLDGKININWGTALYSSILSDKRVKNLTGKNRRDVALSIFQRGTAGYDRYGISTSYLKAYYKKWNILNSYLKKV